MHTDKTNYYATSEGHIAGKYRELGDPIPLTEKEAKYLLLNGQISKTNPKDKPVEEKRSEPDPATLDRKTR
ncbi:hypothetical protein [Agrobacterium tumefaciens]|uniref:hypothetical protein n=1 Tax=Agrobacterium tumefaciens TaxID=358 RepID=UPI0015725319|nr:hypothetical protein [Agrobacterium tumefaciens]NTD85492.1 hypothetical protein [Agrobacterium tumefaciens]NTD90841.1 hypothetical protein [Agrobacterium tumefaciens]NTE03663.1 hypothetical protein [Agrobacterium tumefaciens]NTE15915.1 hypothetical protein [Agrobacterium tumefaciens]NTE26489.1 hypothetical protein [Agrobacterium tumefaciens]